MHLAIAFLGFGAVGRALHALLQAQRDALHRDHGVTFTVTGVASQRLGWCAQRAGLEPTAPAGAPQPDVEAWLAAARPDVVFESIALDPHTGEPALGYLRAVLRAGVHAISANKGPVVHGYHVLRALAAERGCCYRFESAVMDGAPVFSLVRECLPLAGVRAVRGVFTSTATVVLEAIEAGGTLEEGVAHAQRLGIAEADPSYDVDGWDSAVKLCAVATVVLGGALRPADVAREGLRTVGMDAVREAARRGRPYRLVGEVSRGADGALSARVAPVPCDRGGVLGAVRGTTLVTHFDAAMFPGGLTVHSHHPDLTTTAYGMLADLVGVVRAHGR